MTEPRVYYTRNDPSIGWYVYSPVGRIAAGPYPNEGLADERADTFNGAIDQARIPVPDTEHIDPDPVGTVDTGTVPATEHIDGPQSEADVIAADDAALARYESTSPRESFYPGEVYEV